MYLDWIPYFKNYQKINCINNSNNTYDYFYCFYNISINYNKYQCDICGENYYLKYNDLNNNNSFINCYEQLNGHYLDNYENISIYKSCYISCETCEYGGNENEHNCTQCKKNYYIFELNTTLFHNCYNECPYFYYYDNISKKYYCTENETCPKNYNKLIIDKKQCIKDCNKDSIYIYNFQNYCYNESQYNLIKNEILNNTNFEFINTTLINEILDFKTDIKETNSFSSEIFDNSIYNNFPNIIDTIFTHNTIELNSDISTDYKSDPNPNKTELIEILIENLLNKVNIEKLNNEIYKENYNNNNNLNIILTSLYNQKFQDDIIIDLKECEDMLKYHYNISKNDSLYILKIIKEEKGMKIPKMEYEVYYPLYNK